MKKLSARIAVALLAGSALFAGAPAANANQCQDITEGWCELTGKGCELGSSLEEKYGVGWYCTQ